MITQRLRGGWLMWLPLCPSTNDRMRPVRMGRFARDILTTEAREYLEQQAIVLHRWARSVKFHPITTFTPVDVWMILPRTNCDASNYGKVLWDALEKSRIVDNDRYLLPRHQGVFYNAKAPEIIIYLPQPMT